MQQPSPTVKTLKPGEVLFNEGDTSNALYLVRKGTIAVRKRKGSDWIEIARIYSNEVIGELGFFDRQPRSATAIALTAAELLELKFSSVDKVYAQVPEYFQTIIAAVAERLRKANDTIRRLQKNVVPDGSNLAEPAEASQELSASDVLSMGDEKA